MRLDGFFHWDKVENAHTAKWPSKHTLFASLGAQLKTQSKLQMTLLANNLETIVDINTEKITQANAEVEFKSKNMDAQAEQSNPSYQP